MDKQDEERLASLSKENFLDIVTHLGWSPDYIGTIDFERREHVAFLEKNLVTKHLWNAFWAYAGLKFNLYSASIERSAQQKEASDPNKQEKENLRWNDLLVWLRRHAPLNIRNVSNGVLQRFKELAAQGIFNYKREEKRDLWDQMVLRLALFEAATVTHWDLRRLDDVKRQIVEKFGQWDVADAEDLDLARIQSLVLQLRDDQAYCIHPDTQIPTLRPYMVGQNLFSDELLSAHLMPNPVPTWGPALYRETLKASPVVLVSAGPFGNELRELRKKSMPKTEEKT